MSLKFCFVVPCYNEAKNIPNLINELKKINNDHDDIHFVLVDNGSTDTSQELLKTESKDLNFIKTISILENKGMGYGIYSGIKFALINDEYDFVGWTHADLQIPTSSLISAKNIILEKSSQFNNVYLRGRRKNRHTLIERIFTALMALYTSLIKRGIYWDITGLPVLVNRELLKNIVDNSPYGFAFDVHTFIKAKNHSAKIIRFPVYFEERKYGESSWNHGFLSKIKMSIYYIKEIYKI